MVIYFYTEIDGNEVKDAMSPVALATSQELSGYSDEHAGQDQV